MVENEYRERLLEGLPVTERRLDLAGVRTAVLEGGSGPPIVLLHGPGEFAAKWLRVVPHLVGSYRVIAPDLPAHGSSGVLDGQLDIERVLAWLSELIARTCASRPVLVGHVLGGAIAARLAVKQSHLLRHLVLVDSLGLAPFRPAPAFALTLIAFLARPTERTYNRFMHQCSYDLDGLRDELGQRWQPYMSYNLQLANGPNAKFAGRVMRKAGLPVIPPNDLARITVPTSLIWGRYDRANRLKTAEAVSSRYGWPLQVIENCADDPPRDQPSAFLNALRAELARDFDSPSAPPKGAHHV